MSSSSLLVRLALILYHFSSPPLTLRVLLIACLYVTHIIDLISSDCAAVMAIGRTSVGRVDGRTISGMFEQDWRKCGGGIPYLDERDREG